MANRRMFNIALISADEFFELENSAKVLYFFLALTADDDGFINGLNRIQRSLGCSDADLEALISIGYTLYDFRAAKPLSGIGGYTIISVQIYTRRHNVRRRRLCFRLTAARYTI